MALKALLTDLTSGVNAYLTIIPPQQQEGLIMESLTHLFLKGYLDKNLLSLEKEEHQTDQGELLVMNLTYTVVNYQLTNYPMFLTQETQDF